MLIGKGEDARRKDKHFKTTKYAKSIGVERRK